MKSLNFFNFNQKCQLNQSCVFHSSEGTQYQSKVNPRMTLSSLSRTTWSATNARPIQTYLKVWLSLTLQGVLNIYCFSFIPILNYYSKFYKKMNIEVLVTDIELFHIYVTFRLSSFCVHSISSGNNCDGYKGFAVYLKMHSCI